MHKAPNQLPLALKRINNLIQRAKTKEQLAYVGAGELEDLLGAELGKKFLPDVLTLARRDAKWRFAFGCVWTSSFKDRAVAQQIEDALSLYFPNGRP